MTAELQSRLFLVQSLTDAWLEINILLAASVGLGGIGRPALSNNRYIWPFKHVSALKRLGERQATGAIW